MAFAESVLGSPPQCCGPSLDDRLVTGNEKRAGPGQVHTREAGAAESILKT